MKVLLIMAVCLTSVSSSMVDFNVKHYNHYGRDIQDLNYDTLRHRVKRQAPPSGINVDYYVTQCSHGNVDPPAGPSINVQGRQLDYQDATEKAAKLIHLMVRFMPRTIFTRLAENSSVGLFSISKLPTQLFDEFADMPSQCVANCRSDLQTANGIVDCSPYCTNDAYTYNKNFPISYLWAYGNLSRTFVVETNMVCRGFNPGNQGVFSENLLIREYGLTVMTRGFDDATRQRVHVAYEAAAANGTWRGVENAYQYFMMATEAWFNGVTGTDLGGMACLNVQASPSQTSICEDEYDQRQRLKDLDPALYDILTYVYSNKRPYVNGDLSICTW